MGNLSFIAFSAGAAQAVSSWATTAEEVAAWCSRSETQVPPEVIHGWGEQDDVRAFLLLSDGQPVGYGELWIDGAEAEVEIARVIVDPRRRGQRLGRTLVAQLVMAAQAFYPSVFLRLMPANTAALACYRAAGFVRVAPEQEQAWNQHQPQAYLWMTYQAEPSAGTRR